LAIKRRQTDGITQHQRDRGERYSTASQDWRKAVFERDKYTCQECGQVSGYLQAHHIKPFAYFKELRTELSNGITLCRKCHNKTKIPASEMRKIWARKNQAPQEVE